MVDAGAATGGVGETTGTEVATDDAGEAIGAAATTGVADAPSTGL